MPYEFRFKGGIHKSGNELDCNIKFILFFLIAQKEIPFWEAEKEGFVSKKDWTNDFNSGDLSGLFDPNSGKMYQTECSILKLFSLCEHPNGRKLMHSFYIELGGNTEIKIDPFAQPPFGGKFFFSAKGRPLKKAEIIKQLDKESISYKMLIRQQPMNLETLRKVVTITRPELERVNRRRLKI